MTLSLGLKTSLSYTKNSLRQVPGATWFSLYVFFCLVKTDILSKYYLNLVVFPQGVRGYLIALVRPPWGWSTGFRATPLTLGLRPKDLQKPLLVLANFLFNFSAAGPSAVKPYTEKNFRTPEGSLTKATCFDLSNFIILADEPALRAYWTPAPGRSSRFETLRNIGARKISE